MVKICSHPNSKHPSWQLLKKVNDKTQQTNQCWPNLPFSSIFQGLNHWGSNLLVSNVFFWSSCEFVSTRLLNPRPPWFLRSKPCPSCASLLGFPVPIWPTWARSIPRPFRRSWLTHQNHNIFFYIFVCGFVILHILNLANQFYPIFGICMD